MNCEQISEQLIDYIDLKLDSDTSRLIEKHISECANCQKEHGELQQLFGEIKEKHELQPDSKIRNNFMQLISDEKKQQGTKVIRLTIPLKRIAWQSVAAIALLLTGFLSGYQVRNNTHNETVATEQLTEMKNDVDEMKRIMVINLLKNESASQRIKAVNYSEEISRPDSKIIEALINTLNSDKSTNVRLAAVYSLARFKSNETVKDAFIATLNKQDDPMVQIVIINMLVEIEEVKAVEELNILLKNKDLNKEVKQQAEMGIEVLT